MAYFHHRTLSGSSSIRYVLQVASDETTEISSYNGILIPDFIFQLQFGHHHNFVCLSYSCQNSSMFDFFSAQEFTESTNLDECISYLCDYMVENGPFEGLLGFSQVKMKSNEATILEHLRIVSYVFVEFEFI